MTRFTGRIIEDNLGLVDEYEIERIKDEFHDLEIEIDAKKKFVLHHTKNISDINRFFTVFDILGVTSGLDKNLNLIIENHDMKIVRFILENKVLEKN